MTNKTEGASLQINSVLFENNQDDIWQTLVCLNRAADMAIASEVFSRISLNYGDCSKSPVFGHEFLKKARENMYALDRIEHVFFDENLGSAHGHNTLLEGVNAEYILVMNPDIRMEPTCLIEMAKHFSKSDCGMVEAKQLPIEHPKEFNEKTGETPWAATACAMFPTELLKSLGGFDWKTFFLYCDDVDMSWRIRLSGKVVIYEPAAVIFHDKRLGAGGAWQAGEAEKYFSAEAALLLAYKYSRDDIFENIANDFKASDDPVYAKALKSFEERKVKDELPERLDSAHKVAEFVNGAYAKHRYAI